MNKKSYSIKILFFGSTVIFLFFIEGMLIMAFNRNEKPLSTSSTQYLSSKEIEKLQNLVAHGDHGAAIKLGNYFSSLYNSQIIESINSGKINLKTDKFVTPASSYKLSPEEIKKLEPLAKNGDSDAAMKLYRYYWLSAPDEKKSLLWLEIAAREGNASAQYGMAITLHRTGDLDKALYWAEIAKSHNYPYAGDLINEIKDGMQKVNKNP